jgi:hypothetical protein
VNEEAMSPGQPDVEPPMPGQSESETAAPEQIQEESADRKLYHRLDAMGWGLFFVWVGVVFLVDIAAGWALIGIGAITLGMQVIQRALGLKMEGFWVVVGFCFALGGAWNLSGTELPLIPILLIVAGAAIFLKAMKH